MKLEKLLVLAQSLLLTTGSAGPPVIGTVITKGAFRLDNATVSGNATLLEGATIETDRAGSSVQLNSGARLRLGAATKGRLFAERMVLEKGEGQLEDGERYRFEARGLTIQPAAPASHGRIVLAGANRVQVASVQGAFQVRNARGILVANLSAGSAMEFEPQQAGGATRVTGCLANKAGRLILTDETTNVTVEVAGSNLARESGNRVELTGVLDPTSTPLPEASQFVRITRVLRIAQGCGNRQVAAAAGVGGTAAGGAAAGTAAGGILGASTATVAIVGGVAAAATVGGLAAADKLPGQGDPSVSR